MGFKRVKIIQVCFRDEIHFSAIATENQILDTFAKKTYVVGTHQKRHREEI